MAATYKGILTNNGKALIASATLNNKINYSHIAVGDGNGSVPTPLETRTALVNEKARIALNVVEINPNNTNQIVCEAIIPSTTGGFYIRELGLYAGSTMVVNANYPPTYKPLADEGGAREIALKLVINIQNAEVIALYLDNSLIYATRAWVDTNYLRRNELVDNLTTNDATKPLTAKQGKKLQDEKAALAGADFTGGISAPVLVAGNENTSYPSLQFKPKGATNGAILEMAPSGMPYFAIRPKETLNSSTGQIAIFYFPNKTGSQTLATLTDNVASASKWQTARTVSFSGAATGSFSIDGSANASCILTLANSGVVAGTYTSTIQIPSITVNDKGQITGISQQNIRSASVNQSGVVQLNDSLTSTATDQALTAAQGKKLQDEKAPLASPVLTGTASSQVLRIDRNAYPRLEFSPNTAGEHGAIIECSDSGYPYFAVRPKSTLGSGSGQIASFSLPLKTGSQTLVVNSDLGDAASKNVTTSTLDKNPNAILKSGDFGIGTAIRTQSLVADINNLTAPANYGNDTFASATTANNFPFTNNVGNLNVLDAGGSNGYRGQIYTSLNNQRIAYRITSNAGSTWSGWKEFAFTDSNITGNAATATKFATARSINGVNFDGSENITIADDTKLALTGGTITGVVTFNASITLKNGMNSAVAVGFFNSGSAQNINVGGLLVSNAYADASLVPANGIYSKGDIKTIGSMYAIKFEGDLIGNAASASKWQTARTIALTGAITGSATFDGSGNISIDTVGLGVGQTWQNLTASRSLATTYTNSTGKPIMVSVAWEQSNQGEMTLTVGGVAVDRGRQNQVGGGAAVQAIVPAGATYSVTSTANTIAFWSELR
ncbi:hypothetical protein F4W09_02060 [Acinetobacter tandoii]|uniref:Phage tail fibre protein N-terminal domain-containing protein n=1 Tax=Acinetobacter tandoii TaxID=202954 RepID=A0A5N4WVP2_9GAMM|nr:phage tail protein [Acinetobacter tandoii]KAB1859929.1 hypothetical protein F4W09_02060 [Acinetobacter tandoii]